MNIQAIMKHLSEGKSVSEVTEIISRTDFENAVQEYPKITESIPDSVMIEELVKRGFYVIPGRYAERFETLTEQEQETVFSMMQRLQDSPSVSSHTDSESERKTRKKMSAVMPELFEVKL